MIIYLLWKMGKGSGHFELQMIAAIVFLTLAAIVIHEVRSKESTYEHLMEFPTGWIQSFVADNLEAGGMGRRTANNWGHAARFFCAVILILVI